MKTANDVEDIRGQGKNTNQELSSYRAPLVDHDNGVRFCKV